MDRPFKTHRQQLTILRSRNIIIADGSKAINILRKEGYYNIINGYKEIFLDAQVTSQTGEDYYKNGTTFEQMYALYDFDRNLRLILLKYILKMETSLKTKLAYCFSEEYKQNFNYLDITNFDNTDPKKITNLIARLSRVITANTEQKDQGGQFYHYLDKHKELPLWVLVKKLTLGETIHFYNTVKPNVKNAIMAEINNEYNRTYRTNITLNYTTQSEIIYEMLQFINKFRNICAHEERLYNTLIKNKSKIPKINIFYTSRSHTFTSKLFDCIIIVGFFISKKDYQKLTSGIKEEVHALSTKLPQNIYNQILINMGFSKTWETDLKLP